MADQINCFAEIAVLLLMFSFAADSPSTLSLEESSGAAWWWDPKRFVQRDWASSIISVSEDSESKGSDTALMPSSSEGAENDWAIWNMTII